MRIELITSWYRGNVTAPSRQLIIETEKIHFGGERVGERRQEFEKKRRVSKMCFRNRHGYKREDEG